MSTKSGSPTTNVAAPSGSTTAAEPGPTTTYYQQLASNLMASLDQIAAVIPNLEAAHASTAGFVRSHQNVPIEFLATVLAAVEQSSELQSLRKLDPVAARDTLQFLEAFRPVTDKIVAFAKSLQFTMKSRKASLAADSLQIYYLSKGLGRDPNSAPLVAHVENMKRDLGNRGRKKGQTAARKAAAAAGVDTPAAPQEGKAS